MTRERLPPQMKTPAKNQSRKKSTSKIAATILFVLFVLYMLVFLVTQIFFPEKTVQLFGYSFYAVSDTGSMEPELKHNDLIVVVKYDYDKIKEGDTIAFLSEVMLKGEKQTITITHTVEKVITDEVTDEKSFQTKGSNPLAETDKIRVTKDGKDGTNKYIGKYVFKTTLFRKLTAFLNSIYGIAALIMVFVSVTVTLIVLRRGKEKSI